MNFGITQKDRKAIKLTCIITSVLFVVFAALSLFFGLLIPKTDEIKALGEGKEEIKSLVEGKDGSDYFLLTDDAMYRYDAFTNEEISTFSLSEIEDLLETKGEKDTLTVGSLTQWSVRYMGVGEQDYYLVNDGNGNMFKLADDGENLTLTDDYYLVTSKTVLKGCDNVGEKLYALALSSTNNYYVYEYSLGNLSAGVAKSKMIWDIDLSGDKAGYKKISPMPASTGILAFEATEDYLYVFRDGGSVVKMSVNMSDCVIDGQEVDFFRLADEYYTEHYTAAYDVAYTEFFRNKLLNNKSEKNTYTEAEILAADKDRLVEMYGTIVSVVTVGNAQTEADEYAKDAAEGGFAVANPWGSSYDKATNSVYVSEEYLGGEYYSVVYAGEGTIYGIVFSEKNQAAYFTNASDGYLYYVEKADLDKVAVGGFLSGVAKRIDSVYCGKDKKFSNFGNGLGYNKFANTLYLKFQNERTISIVDINDKENCEVLHTYQGDFDVYSLTGDKDNTVTHVLRQVSKVSLDGATSVRLYACTYQPSRFEQKALITTLFIVAIVLAVLLLLVSLWLFLAFKNERQMRKVKIISRDLKKHKYVYLALVGFVVLLVMFCYYEAIGALSMSFFDYTREKPAWIWNSFGNYLRIFNQPDFWLSIGNMLFFLLSDLFFCIVPPLIFAFLLVLIRNKVLSGWIRAAMFIPSIIPSMATMLIWREGIYGADGIFNQIVMLFGGTPIEYLDNVDYSRWSLIFMGFPFIGGYLIFYGGMMNIPTEYHEAGRLEGLGIIKRFFSIDIPLIMPQIKYIFIMTFIDSVQNYARTYILGSSGTITPVENMYRIMTGTQADYGMASAYATILFVFLFFAVATNFKMQRKDTMGEDL